jgi:hypothetical protein
VWWGLRWRCCYNESFNVHICFALKYQPDGAGGKQQQQEQQQQQVLSCTDAAAAMGGIKNRDEKRKAAKVFRCGR